MKAGRFRLLMLLAIFIFASLVNANELNQLIAKGDKNQVEKVLKDKPELLNKQDKDFLTPVNKAALLGNLELVKLFIESGADLNIGDKEGSYAIHNAAALGHFETVKYLLSNGVKIN